MKPPVLSAFQTWSHQRIAPQNRKGGTGKNLNFPVWYIWDFSSLSSVALLCWYSESNSALLPDAVFVLVQICFIWYSCCLWEQATWIMKPLACKWLYAESCTNIIVWINELFSEQQNWWAQLLNDQCLVDGFCAKDWSHDSVLPLVGALIGSLLSGHLPEGFFLGFNWSVRVPSQWLLCWNVSWTTKRCTQIRISTIVQALTIIVALQCSSD